jgi:hypothetical protein
LGPEGEFFDDFIHRFFFQMASTWFRVPRCIPSMRMESSWFCIIPADRACVSVSGSVVDAPMGFPKVLVHDILAREPRS